MKRVIILICLIISTSTSVKLSAATKPETHSFESGKGQFLLDGKPFVIKAAELHYARIPADYWEHRILMCRHWE